MTLKDKLFLFLPPTVAVVFSFIFLISLTLFVTDDLKRSEYKMGDCFESDHHFYEVIKLGKYGSLEAINFSPYTSNSAVWSKNELDKATKVDCFEMFEKKESK